MSDLGFQGSAAIYRVLADMTVMLHAAFVFFVVAGQVLIWMGWAIGWRWTRGPLFRGCHLASIGFVALEAWFGVDCPLTVLENRFRISAGGNPYAVSFIGYWLGRFLFYSAPDWIFTLVYTVFGVLVLTTYIIYPPAKRG